MRKLHNWPLRLARTIGTQKRQLIRSVANNVKSIRLAPIQCFKYVHWICHITTHIYMNSQTCARVSTPFSFPHDNGRPCWAPAFWKCASLRKAQLYFEFRAFIYRKYYINSFSCCLKRIFKSILFKCCHYRSCDLTKKMTNVNDKKI